MSANPFSLIRWDIVRFKGWFTRKTFAKSAVILVFLILLAFIALGIHFYSYNVLIYLSIQDKFGLAVGDYILALSFFVVLVIGIASSAASSLQSHFSTKSLEHLLSLPLSSARLFWIKSIEIFIPSTWPIFVILIPIILAYLRVFPQLSNPYFLTIIATTLIAILIHSLGSVLSFILASFTHRLRSVHYLLAMIIASFFIMPFIRFLIPLGLKQVYQATSLDQFASELYAMPLFSSVIPSNWIWPIITLNYWQLIPALILGFILIYLLLHYIAKKYYLSLVQSHQNKVFVNTKTGHHRPSYGTSSSATVQIIRNDLYSLFNNSYESTYAIFALILFIVLSIVSTRIPIDRAIEQGWFSFAIGVVWFGFFSLITLAASRFVFPLMFKEYKSPHILFLAPISKAKIFLAKMTSAIIISLIPTLIGLVVLLKTGIYKNGVTDAIYLYLLASYSIVIIQLSFGISNQDNDYSDSIDAATTSTAGILASILSFVVIFSTIYSALTSISSVFIALIVVLISGSLITSRMQLNRFEA